MGYTIEYIGSFELNKPLTEEHAKFLRDFAKTRHYVRAYPENDPNGIFFTDPKGEFEPTWKDLDYKSTSDENVAELQSIAYEKLRDLFTK